MTHQQPAAFLWDMDGTIIDTEPAWIIAEQALLNSWGSDLQESDAIDWVGIGLWDLAEIMRERGVELHPDEIVAWLTNHVNNQIFSAELNWRPGARELAHDIKASGMTNILVTMASRAQAKAIIDHLPKGTFAGIIAGDDVEHPKPHPDPYERGANLAGADAADCVAIEDSTIGIMSAHRAGAFVIGVPHLVDLTHAPLDALVSSLTELDAAGIVEMFVSHKQLHRLKGNE